MKNLDRTLKLLCPLCGNDQFGSLDVDMDELYDAPDNVKVQCADCKNIFTKEALFEENSEAIEATIDNIKDEFIAELKKSLKKWK